MRLTSFEWKEIVCSAQFPRIRWLIENINKDHFLDNKFALHTRRANLQIMFRWKTFDAGWRSSFPYQNRIHVLQHIHIVDAVTAWYFLCSRSHITFEAIHLLLSVCIYRSKVATSRYKRLSKSRKLFPGKSARPELHHLFRTKHLLLLIWLIICWINCHFIVDSSSVQPLLHSPRALDIFDVWNTFRYHQFIRFVFSMQRGSNGKQWWDYKLFTLTSVTSSWCYKTIFGGNL